VALARALITDPEALLLDEPLSALDPFLKIRMRAELKKLQKTLGITFVHVTHSQEEAMALADVIVIMNDGKIEQAAPPREVFERPATAFVARFMGDHNVLSGRVTSVKDDMLVLEAPEGQTFSVRGDGRLVGEAVDIGIRTDRVRLEAASDKTLGFGGVVSNIEYRGATVKLTVIGAGSDDFTVIASDGDYFAKPVSVGDAVSLSWALEDAVLLGRA
jgi:putative spermidine/putrescine transport system ATP-binding protein